MTTGFFYVFSVSNSKLILVTGISFYNQFNPKIQTINIMPQRSALSVQELENVPGTSKDSVSEVIYRASVILNTCLPIFRIRKTITRKRSTKWKILRKCFRCELPISAHVNNVIVSVESDSPTTIVPVHQSVQLFYKPLPLIRKGAAVKKAVQELQRSDQSIVPLSELPPLKF